MFDFVTRRRLIFFLVAISFVIISILFFAQIHSRIIPSFNRISSSSNISIDNKEQINTCYLTESIEIITACQKCTSYEQRSQAASCLSSGYKESILCTTSKIQTYRSCPIPKHIQKQHFWLFEGIIFLIGLISIIGVHSRQKILDKQMVEKIKKQIGENDE